MTRQIVHIDLFSGMGGFAKGFQNAGLKADHHYFSEIERHPIANYRYNFPHSIALGNANTVSGSEIRKRHPNAIIIVTFGWPCQDNSIAGKRHGQRHHSKRDLYVSEANKGNEDERRGSHAESLGAETEGTRSGLLFEAVRIVRESGADYFIAENVKGLLSVNAGIDIIESFVILTGLLQDSAQYDLEMQLFDTLWYLPQRRERTYFVGRSRNRSGSPLLPVTFSGNEPDKKTGKGGPYAGTLTTKNQSPQFNVDSSSVYVGKTVRNEESKKIRKANQRAGNDTNPFGAKDLEFRNQRFMNSIITTPGADNLVSEPKKLLQYSRDQKGKIEKYTLSDIAGTIHQSSGMGGNTDQFVLISRDGVVKEKSHASTLQVGGNAGGNHSQMDLLAIISLDGRVKPKKNHSGSITKNYRASSNTGDMDLLQLSDLSIRRLTEIECERLQGFPDDWSKYGISKNGKVYEIKSTPRYTMIGNAVSTVCAEYLAAQLLSIITNESSYE